MSKRISRWTGPLAVGVLCAGLFGSAFTATAKADDWDQRTVVTIDQSVEVPGVVLQPGTYVFKLFSSNAERKVVQVFNADENRLIASFIGVPIYRDTPSGQTILRFNESQTNAPETLRAWFYPGRNYGLRFNYSQSPNLKSAD